MLGFAPRREPLENHVFEDRCRGKMVIHRPHPISQTCGAGANGRLDDLLEEKQVAAASIDDAPKSSSIDRFPHHRTNELGGARVVKRA